jgi:hypothetical protein
MKTKGKNIVQNPELSNECDRPFQGDKTGEISRMFSAIEIGV